MSDLNCPEDCVPSMPSATIRVAIIHTFLQIPFFEVQTLLYEEVQDLETHSSVVGTEQGAGPDLVHNVRAHQELLYPLRYPAVGLSVELHKIRQPSCRQHTSCL